MHYSCCNIIVLFSTVCLFGQAAWALTSATTSTITLKTTSTTYLARLHSLESDRHVLALHSIPFAQPPIGPRRFLPPQPIEKMAPVVDARSFPATCMQMPHMKTAASHILRSTDFERISEDCLYMSIYVPVHGPIPTSAHNQSVQLSTEQIVSRNADRSLPVLAWFAGEGYDFADARQFDGSALAAATNSIVVSIQYRVGVFGFLRIDGVTDGNQALWDQIAALQWLQNHVAEFGGNKHAVTASGRFTGSMSLSILLTSPMLANRRMFDRAVLISGVAAGDWVFDSRPTERLHSLAQQLDCPITDSTNSISLIECLQKTSPTRLLATAGFGWKPVYDGRLVVGQPISLLESGLFAANVSDVLIGSTENDGSLCYQTQQAIHSLAAVAIDSGRLQRDSYLQLVHQDLEMFFDNQPSSIQRIFEMMVNAKHDTNDNYSSMYIRFCTQLLTRSHQDRFAQLLRDRTQVSTYRLMAQPSVTSSPSSLSNAGFGDDVLLAFGDWSAPSDRKLAANYRSMLGAFVHKGISGLHAARLHASANRDIHVNGPAQVAGSSAIQSIFAESDATPAPSALDSLRSQLHNTPAVSGFGCHGSVSPASSSDHSAPRARHSLLTRLFEHATQRNATSHIACVHLNSKTDFLRLVEQPIIPTLLPLHSS